jgi:hypothetical protein
VVTWVSLSVASCGVPLPYDPTRSWVDSARPRSKRALGHPDRVEARGYYKEVEILPTRQMRCVPAPRGVGPGLCGMLDMDFAEFPFYDVCE